MPDSHAPVGLLAEHGALARRSRGFSERYGLPLLKKVPPHGLYLRLADSVLELVEAGAKSPGATRVDFVAGSMGHRLRFGGGRGQPLARAVGLKPGFNPSVWDATAGLGRDGFILASLGCRVTLSERCAVLVALLADGLERAALDAEIGTWVGQRIRLLHGESADLLKTLTASERPDVVYLDPMYPAGKAHVLVKKDMRALQQLLGAQSDTAPLLEAALAAARRRVVVKRPKRADWLAGRAPSASIESKKTRYDLYVTL